MSGRNSDSDFTDIETPDVDHDDKRIKDLTTFLSSYKPKKSVNLRSRKTGSSASGSQPTLDSKFFEELIKHMNSVHEKLDEICSQLKISNEKSVKNENDIRMLKEKINDKDKKIDELETRLDDLERRSRNDKVLLTGGNLEDSTMNDAEFVKNLMSTTLGIDDYYSFKVERIGKNSRGGGVLMYVRNDIAVEVIDNLTGICDSHESLFIRFNLRGFGKVILGGIYRPPNGSIADFNIFLLNALNDIRRLSSRCILMGDFNINYFCNLNIDSAEYFNILVRFCYQFLITVPTYVSPANVDYLSLIDHIWSNLHCNTEAFILEFLVADHFPSLVFFDFQLNDARKVSFRDFSVGNIVKFNEACNNTVVFNVSPELPVDDLVESFLNWVNGIVNKFFPIKTKQISYKRSSSPWISKSIMTCVRKKHKLFKMLKIHQISYAQFKSYSVLLKYLLKYAKRNYYKKRFNNCKNSIKNKWNEINDLLGKNRTNNVTCLSVGDDEITDDIEIVETFNNYFSNVAVETAGLVGEPVNDYLNLLPNVQESFFIFPSTPDEVEKIISNLGSNNPLLDIPVKFLKMARIYPSISYGIVVWGGALVASRSLGSITSLHNKIIVALFGSHVNSNRVDIICKNINISGLAKTVYLALQGEHLPFLTNTLDQLIVTHTYETRSRHNFTVPYHRINVFKYNFLYRAINEWNKLPLEIRNIASIDKF
ncbi:hypothetical protein Anas_13851, partial [Armadillidium nasatum]